MRINHIIISAHGGGATVNTLRMISHLSSYDHQLFVLTGEVNSIVPPEGKNLTIHYLGLRPNFHSLIKIRQIFKSFTLNETIITNGFGSLVIAVFFSLNICYKNWFHITRGVNFHGRKFLIKWLFYFLLVRVFTKIRYIFVSSSEMENFRKKIFLKKSFITKNGWDIIGNGMPENYFLHSKNIKNCLYSKEINYIKILCISRVVDQKNILGLINLVAKARDFGVFRKRFCIHVYGECPDTSYLEKCRRSVDKKGLAGMITFVGEQTISPDTYGSYHLLVHNAKFEGLATVITEASAAGLLYITNEVVGTCDFKKPWNQPLFFNNSESFMLSLEYAMYCLMEDIELSKWIRNKNRNDVVERLSLKHTMEKYQKLFDEV